MAGEAPAAGGSNGRDARVLAIDAGGTMTDTFIVDRAGEFVVGKAQTTPEDESAGFMASARDALAHWDTEPEAAMPQIVSGIYSGTAMINRGSRTMKTPTVQTAMLAARTTSPPPRTAARASRVISERNARGPKTRNGSIRANAHSARISRRK